MSKDANPISKFFATILHLTLVMIVIGVVIAMAEAKETGEEINPVEAVAKQSHQVWIDLKNGWSSVEDSSKKDTIK